MSQKHTLQLPFRGSWFVFWGGDTKQLNYHHDDPAEKYALDMVVLDENKKTYSGSGSSNEDYHAFDQSILATADGEVIEAVDGLRDNMPQKTTNNYAYSGNFVMIKHAENLYSVSAHLRQGSVAVTAGQKVVVGQIIGQCGNSGNSTEPHLHFHLQDSDILTTLTAEYKRQPRAKGVKSYFAAMVWRDGKPQQRQQRHAPIKGDTLSHP